MNDNGEQKRTSNIESLSPEENEKFSKIDSNAFSNNKKDTGMNPGISEYFHKNQNNNYNVIKSYYFSTHNYLMKSKENLNNFLYKKNSKNFVRKNIMNSSYKNELNNNYKINYFNSDKLNKSYAYINKSNFHNSNKEVCNESNNFLFNRNIGIINKSQNCLNYNNIFYSAQQRKDNNINIFGDNFCNLSSVYIKNDNNIIINNINYPSFIPKNFSKKDKGNIGIFRENSQESSSKDKESDSTSSLSETKFDNINSKKSKEKIQIKEKTENGVNMKPEDYLLEMFGRKGWICRLCNNFNYETRIKCNRCGIFKNPKKLIEMRKRKRNIENNDNCGDWVCLHCKNINYSFRAICNRCKLPRIRPIINNQFINIINLPMLQIPSSPFSLNNGQPLFYNK